MKRSPMLDAMLVASFAVGATAMAAFLKDMPERCPRPTPSSVESLFAPCLAAERRDPSPADIVALYLPPPAARGGTAVATTPARDVDATGSVTEPGR